jgi:glycosyltransferase involved in cell wall biosynthesis
MIRLSMIVKNEEDRYLTRVLESALRYVDDAVIIDDASTDGTAALCRKLLRNIPCRVIENTEPKFHNEWELRYQQWTESTSDNPDWLLFLDADEIFEDSFEEGVKELTADEGCWLYSFRLYDFWNEEHYRDDTFWKAHYVYRPFLLRYNQDYPYSFKRTNQHCGRMPFNVFEQPNQVSHYRVKHYGWAKEEDRIAKYERYMRFDPEGKYGSIYQYQSIMDADPKLVKWVE